MYIQYSLLDIDFEWDGQKAYRNIKNHHISFEKASEAFFDPFVLYLGDEIIRNELRETMIGLTKDWRLLYVVYVMRDETIRLISARPVTNPERRLYEHQ